MSRFDEDAWCDSEFWDDGAIDEITADGIAIETLAQIETIIINAFSDDENQMSLDGQSVVALVERMCNELGTLVEIAGRVEELEAENEQLRQRLESAMAIAQEDRRMSGKLVVQ